ncbi:MAG: hypothetical protein JO356_00865 [Acidobacteria bacterium]|nr:hypothetical protein [Acidobacteriota bacterium]
MRPTDAQTPDRYPLTGVLIALLACFLTGIGPSRIIPGIPGTALGAVSFYILMVFYLRITNAIQFSREPRVRLWQAASLLASVAAVSWAMLLLGGVPQPLGQGLACVPFGILMAFLGGPWKWLFPCQPESKTRVDGKRKERNS